MPLSRPCPIGAPAEIHYTPAEDLETIDVAFIRGAEKQIDMAVYVLTDRAVIETMRQAAARGVRVRIWRDASMAERVGDSDIEAQLGGRVPGIEIRSNAPGGELMHLKDYCLDHRLLRTGSANFSRSGETRQATSLWRSEARPFARALTRSSITLGQELQRSNAASPSGHLTCTPMPE